MYQKNIFLSILFTTFPLIFCIGQSANLPLRKDYQYLLDRYQVKSGTFAGGFHSTFRPYPRKSLTSLLDTLEDNNTLSEIDHFNLLYLKNDNWEWFENVDNKSKKPILKHFYRVKSDLYHVQTNDFDLHVNPVAHWSIGTVSNDDRTPYINTRGVEFRGMIDNKIGFYSFLGENQARFPVYVRDWINDQNVVPHEGFWKDFGEEGVDFFTPRGYISFNATKHVNFQFGYDRFFIGNGYRSLILSDFAPPYLFLKINTRIWKINYTNLFTEMKADAFGTSMGSLSGERFPEKYVNYHHLGINITDNFKIGLFEAVVFGMEDSLGNSKYELSYLNPIIFYRAIEQQNGSIDNAILGMDFLWNIARRYSVYGQFVLDEFILDEFFSNSGWWGNKYGIQIGAKYFDVFGLANLDLQLEFNTVRPYTYSHSTIFTNLAHYRQPLAHPLGANFREWLGILRYQPLNRLFLTGKIFLSEYGEDLAGNNYGSNILLDNRTRIMNFNNETGQGVNTNLNYLSFDASYMLKHNLFIDGKVVYRNLQSELSSRDMTNTYVLLALRFNIKKRLHEF